MKSEKHNRAMGRLLLGAATGLATILAGGLLPAQAQGWTAEMAELSQKPAAVPPVRKGGKARVEKATAKAKTKAKPASNGWTAIQTKIDPPKVEPQKTDAAKAGEPDQAPTPAEPVKAEADRPTADPVKAEPAGAASAVDEEAPVLITSATKPQVHPAAAPAASPAPAPAAVTAQAPLTPNAALAEEAEPRDPFADVRLVQRPGAGDQQLTTQVVPGDPPNAALTQAAPPDRNAAGQYCSNIADAAIDARIAWQRQNLAEAEKQIQIRTAELEAKTAEFQRWLARRDEFSQKAQKVVVDIYTKMRPDAAAAQLQVLDDETAAAVLTKLDTRAASAVMNEMEPAQAARLTAIISGAARGPQSRKPPPAAPATPAPGNPS